MNACGIVLVSCRMATSGEEQVPIAAQTAELRSATITPMAAFTST